MENQSLISTINGTEIVTVDRDGEIFVPIKPICTALGIAFPPQYNKLQEDETLSSTVTIIVTVGADEKDREMVCLPLKYVYGWLFTINPKNVAATARESVTRYRQECYEVLYEHFTASMARTIETNNAEIALLSEINDALNSEKEAKAQRRKLEQSLQKLRTERLNPQPQLF